MSQTPHSERAGRAHTKAHSRGSTIRVKTKRQICTLFFAQRAAPALLTKLRAACTGLSPLSRLQKHLPHPPDWHCHIKAPQNPLQQSRIWLRQHTYPNTRLHTIKHYSGVRGLLLQITMATMTGQATTTPPPHLNSFPVMPKLCIHSPASSKEIDPLHSWRNT